MAELEAGARLRALADTAATFHTDQHIPIRRYYRSGQEMVKMAEVYQAEGSTESAYVLYMKFVILQVEKLPQHRDYPSVLPQERRAAKARAGQVMERMAVLKEELRARFEAEHEQWRREEAVRREEQVRREEEERRAREEEARRRAAEAASIEKDRQVAVWHQAQLDAEARGLPPPPPPASLPSSASSLPSPPHSSIEHSLSLDRQRPPYEPSRYEAPPSHPSAPPSHPSAPPSYPTAPPSTSPPPSYDRCTKPSASSLPSTSSLPPTSTSLPPTSTPLPSYDRSSKPSPSSPGLRRVAVPSDLVPTFLSVAAANSGRGVETLGTLGGSLAQDRLVISHLVIPRQTGKSDSCTMEGLEDVWDVHDKEGIIFLGWIHTHPEYDVFLSSVDMHNQYEWQHMLPEAVAIVCSIKYSSTGFLSLTQAGLQEIGRCDQVNFHPHSKEPPLFEAATHVEVSPAITTTLKDLR